MSNKNVFDKRRFAEREISLALGILERNPSSEEQRDRVSYWALEIGNMELAEQYGTSKKMQNIINERKVKL